MEDGRFRALGGDLSRPIPKPAGGRPSEAGMPFAAQRLHLRLTNDRHIVTMHYSADGRAWRRPPWRYEVSGYHQNVFGGFLSLRPALYASGEGEVRYTDFRYRAL